MGLLGYGPTYNIVYRFAQNQRVQVPIGAEGMEQEAVEKDCRGEVLDVLVYGKKRGHADVAALHDDIRHSQEKERPQEGLRWFGHIHQVTRQEQEAWHVEGIHHLLDVRVQLLEIDQVETDDEQYENAF